jgi:hypothetical protein
LRLFRFLSRRSI